MIVACAGAPRKELAERRLSPELGQVMEARQLYRGTKDGPPALLCQGEPSLEVLAAAPVLSGGDLLGCVAYAGEGGVAGETECKLAQAMANFLGRHMEQ
jgi:AbrB family transcriptional regulator (stage V sporulation protein T)